MQNILRRDEKIMQADEEKTLCTEIKNILKQKEKQIQSQVNPKSKPECQLNHNLINKKMTWKLMTNIDQI